MQPPSLPPAPVTAITCRWCAQPMNSADIRCPHCSKLRKDIYADKVKSYIFCLIGVLLIVLSLSTWKSNRRNEFDYFENTSSTDYVLNYLLLAIGIVAAIIGIYF